MSKCNAETEFNVDEFLDLKYEQVKEGSPFLYQNDIFFKSDRGKAYRMGDRAHFQFVKSEIVKHIRISIEIIK